MHVYVCARMFWSILRFNFFLKLNFVLISLRISGLDNPASVGLPTVVEGLQRRKQSKKRPEMTGQTSSDEKVSMEFQMFWRFFVQEISSPVLLRPVLYIGTLGRLFPQ